LIPTRAQLRQRAQLSGHFEEWTSPPGEYGMVLVENCIIHMIEDDAIPDPALGEYGGQDAGAFYLRRSQANALLSKLRSRESK